jgi:uncharacterized protein
MIRRIIKWLLGGLLILAIAFAGLIAWNWEMVQRIFLGGVKVYETTAPTLPADIKRPAILVFSKANGFRHDEAIAAANALFAKMAGSEGWGHYQTDNGAAFSPEILARFDAVVFNNVSGDVFTPDQRAAFKDYVEKGGGFVGIHGSGGDMRYAWHWYRDTMIGAQFIGHPMNPQFQRATVRVEDRTHPATASLKDSWVRIDEWYSFDKSVRRPGYHVLLSLDESSYSPKGVWGADLRMGKDHPIAWWHCTGKGRALYSALGHQASAYAEAPYAEMLRGATRWALRLEGSGCDDDTRAGSEKP